MENIYEQLQPSYDKLAYRLTVGRRLAQIIKKNDLEFGGAPLEPARPDKPYPGQRTNYGFIPPRPEQPPGLPPEQQLRLEWLEEDDDEDEV